MKVLSIEKTSEKFSKGEIKDGVHSISPAAWSDAQLISSVRYDPSDEVALDVLVSRHGDSLFANCQMLTSNHEKALDLAQATWCRLLQNRQTIKTNGNFPAYLTTIATNLFRDAYRSARRAGPMADHQLLSLDVSFTNDEGESVFLVSALPDLHSHRAEERSLLKMDIDSALRQLPPLLSAVIVARYIEGESCSEIGLRHRRTEQTVSAWIREALRQMRTYLEELDGTVNHRKPVGCS